jgi:hypothetical protein
VRLKIKTPEAVSLIRQKSRTGQAEFEIVLALETLEELGQATEEERDQLVHHQQMIRERCERKLTQLRPTP